MMRMVERTLRSVRIAPRIVTTDGLGGAVEGFSDSRFAYRCVAVPGGDTLNYAANSVSPLEHGAYQRQNLKLLLPRNAVVRLGDGICLDDDEAPRWRCIALESWSSHLVAKIERLA